MIPRQIQADLRNSIKSCLLLGPRQTGKSTLIRSFKPDLTINLMRESTYLEFAANAKELEQLLSKHQPKTVFIDEIQRLPSLFNTIQVILDETPSPPKFFLTGSSARKLRRGNANLIPGRIFVFHLFGICSHEFEHYLPEDVLAYGSLPEVLMLESSKNREKLLVSYTGTYLKEEVQAEALTKNIEGFARFLFVAAADATKFLDLAKLAEQAKIERHSAVRWFEILEDTLLVSRSGPFAKSSRTRLTQHPRYFFFDNGVLNALLKNFLTSEDRKGFLFENLFFTQLKATAAAFDKEIEISSFRTEHGAEIDFILEVGNEIWAIECKSADHIKSVGRGFNSFQSFYKKPHRAAIAYMGEAKKEINGVLVMPWQELLKEIFVG